MLTTLAIHFHAIVSQARAEKLIASYLLHLPVNAQRPAKLVHLDLQEWTEDDGRTRQSWTAVVKGPHAGDLAEALAHMDDWLAPEAHAQYEDLDGFGYPMNARTGERYDWSGSLLNADRRR